MAKNPISFLVVIGTSGAHEETFMLTCKVLARLMGASRQGLHLAQITDQQQLTTLLRLAVHGKKSSQLWLNHAIYCLLVDCLKWNKNQVKMTSTATMFAPRYESTRSTPDLDPVSGGSSTNGTPVLTKKQMAAAAAPPKVIPPGIPHELLVYEQTKSSMKLDKHVDDILELFDNPNSESVPPVLKKAWPSISRFVDFIPSVNFIHFKVHSVAVS